MASQKTPDDPERKKLNPEKIEILIDNLLLKINISLVLVQEINNVKNRKVDGVKVQ